MKKILLTFLIISTLLNAQNDFVSKEILGKRITLVKNDFKILEFKKRIIDIVVSDSKKLKILFSENNNKPFRTIKLYAKDLGYSKLLITFADKTILLNEVSIIENFSKVIEVIQAINPDVEVHQANGKVILKGYTKDTKERNKIETLFKSAGVDIEKNMLNLLEVRKPNKMIRIKLYVTEIKKTNTLDIQNNWSFLFGDGTTNVNVGLDTATAAASAVTVSGGLSLAANRMGSKFNPSVALKYLATEGVATVLDETELITLENKKSTFHAGGRIYVKVQTTTAEGLPTTELKEIDYGLKLEVEVNNIINNEFIDMTLTTKQDKIDWTNQVDGIPSFSNQAINTYVIIQNKSTIVLGGMVNANDSKNYWKIPYLGDIPILGALFRSKSFNNGDSELVFFIIPEIVDPSQSNDINKLKEAKEKLTQLTNKNIKKEKKVIKKEKKLTNEELHQKRLKEIFNL